MDFDWSWLGKGKCREDNTSDENKNPKHRWKSRSEIVKDSPVKSDGQPHASLVIPPSKKLTIDRNMSDFEEEIHACYWKMVTNFLPNLI